MLNEANIATNIVYLKQEKKRVDYLANQLKAVCFNLSKLLANVEISSIFADFKSVDVSSVKLYDVNYEAALERVIDSRHDLIVFLRQYNSTGRVDRTLFSEVIKLPVLTLISAYLILRFKHFILNNMTMLDSLIVDVTRVIDSSFSSSIVTARYFDDVNTYLHDDLNKLVALMDRPIVACVKNFLKFLISEQYPYLMGSKAYSCSSLQEIISVYETVNFLASITASIRLSNDSLLLKLESLFVNINFEHKNNELVYFFKLSNDISELIMYDRSSSITLDELYFGIMAVVNMLVDLLNVTSLEFMALVYSLMLVLDKVTVSSCPGHNYFLKQKLSVILDKKSIYPFMDLFRAYRVSDSVIVYHTNILQKYVYCFNNLLEHDYYQFTSLKPDQCVGPIDFPPLKENESFLTQKIQSFNRLKLYK